MDNLTCDVIKDIMPISNDGICSKKTKQLIEEHIKDCLECRKEWEMISDSSIQKKIKEDNKKVFQDLTNKIKKKNSKKTMLIILAATCISIVSIISFGLIILGLLSFGNQAYVTNDLSNYGIHQGHVDGEKENLRGGFYIFPKELPKKANEINFMYLCVGAGFSPDYQQILKCTYTDEEYQLEIERLKKISCTISTKNGDIVNKVEYSETKFNYPAYITSFGGGKLFEYALCDVQRKTIIYIYIQTISLEKVAFSKDYLPREYGEIYKKLDNNDFEDTSNIYYSKLKSGIFVKFKD